jgi:hypothetical protein
MITGKVKQTQLVKPQVEYRKLTSLNYSMLKVWDENPSLFFDQYKLGKTRKSKPSMSTTVGDIAHFFVLDCHGDEREFDNRIDEKFAQLDYELGTGQVFILCDHLFDVTEENTNEEGICTMAMADMFDEAFNRVKAQDKYKGKDIDKVWDDFEKNGQDYYKSRIANIGKIMVTPVMLDKGKFVGQSVLRDENTSHIFLGSKDTLHTSFPIEWLYDNVDCTQTKCKSELDLFKIDHKKKKIYLYDLKCTWDNEGFTYGYLKYYYYIQQAFYWLAAKYYFSHIEDQYSDYEIVPMQYIVADTSLNNRRPLIFPCTEKDLLAGLDGFKLSHREYRGVNQLMDELCWAENNNIWNMSKDAYSQNGIMRLDFDYQLNTAV